MYRQRSTSIDFNQFVFGGVAGSSCVIHAGIFETQPLLSALYRVPSRRRCVSFPVISPPYAPHHCQASRVHTLKCTVYNSGRSPPSRHEHMDGIEPAMDLSSLRKKCNPPDFCSGHCDDVTLFLERRRRNACDIPGAILVYLHRGRTLQCSDQCRCLHCLCLLFTIRDRLGNCRCSFITAYPRIVILTAPQTATKFLLIPTTTVFVQPGLQAVILLSIRRLEMGTGRYAAV